MGEIESFSGDDLDELGQDGEPSRENCELEMGEMALVVEVKTKLELSELSENRLGVNTGCLWCLKVGLADKVGPEVVEKDL